MINLLLLVEFKEGEVFDWSSGLEEADDSQLYFEPSAGYMYLSYLHLSYFEIKQEAKGSLKRCKSSIIRVCQERTHSFYMKASLKKGSNQNFR